MKVPYVVDATSGVARAFGASVTPEAFLFDKTGTLAYHGTIDDNRKEPDKVKARDLKDALDAVVAGKAPAVPETKGLGCGIKFRVKARRSGHPRRAGLRPRTAAGLAPQVRRRRMQGDTHVSYYPLFALVERHGARGEWRGGLSWHRAPSPSRRSPPARRAAAATSPGTGRAGTTAGKLGQTGSGPTGAAGSTRPPGRRGAAGTTGAAGRRARPERQARLDAGRRWDDRRPRGDGRRPGTAAPRATRRSGTTGGAGGAEPPAGSRRAATTTRPARLKGRLRGLRDRDAGRRPCEHQGNAGA
jgi:hypothetical protein